MSKIKLGIEAKDLITGYTGIVIGELNHLHGGREYKLQKQMSEDNKYPPSEWIDESYLQKVSEGVHIEPVVRELGFTPSKLTQQVNSIKEKR